MDALELGRRVIAIEIAELQRLHDRLDDSFARAVQALARVVEARGKIVVVGVGKSGHIGEKIAATLTSTGAPAVVLDSQNALHGDLGIVSDGDAVIALSASGETDELVSLLPWLMRFEITLIAITGRADSTLGRAAHVVLDANVAQEACPLNLAPTSSTTVSLVLGDALAMVLLEARGFSKADFAKFHPGGSLGRALLLRVEQVMRTRDRVAAVPAGATVMDALHEMTRHRTGAAVIVDDADRVQGVFTHGDFARHFQRDAGIGVRVLKTLMTRNPRTIRADQLAAEALRELQTSRIDDLIVVDGEGRVVGLVDTQDLARMKLV